MASNRIDSATIELKKCLKLKVDQVLFDREIEIRDQQYERILQVLDSIERKIDGRTSANIDGPAQPGDPG